MITLIRRAWRDTEEGKSFLKLVILFFITGMFMLASSQTIGILTQSILNNNSSDILLLFLIFIIVESFVFSLNYFRAIYQSKIIQRMKAKFKAITMKSYLDSEYKFSQEMEQGDLLGRLDSDITSAVTASNMTINLVKSSVLLILLAGGIFIINFKLFILFIIPLIFVTCFQLYVSRFVSDLIMPWKESMGRSFAMTQDIVNNRGTVRIYQLYKKVEAWLSEVLNDTRNIGIKAILKLYIVQTPLFLLTTLPLIAILVGGTYMVSLGTLSVASLISSLMIAQLAIDEFNPIINGAQNIPHLMTSAKRLYPIWDSNKENFSCDMGNLEPLIEMKNVSFAFDEDKQVLTDLSLVIHQGEHIGIVGPSGSGKSTVFNLLTGFYTPLTGTMKVKDIEVNQWDKIQFRNLFGVVSQNSYLFNRSILDNFRIIDPNIKEGELEQLLLDMKLDKNIHDLVGEKGSHLSGGERQRLNIARALYRDPEILLFDEASSALDVKTEELINSKINDRNNQQTKVIIAHRMSSIRNCDRIYVLNRGVIEEVGTHQELMNNAGLYHSMVISQKGESYGTGE